MLQSEQICIRPQPGFHGPHHPVLLYRGAAGSTVSAESMEKLFRGNGWGESWRNGIFDYHHFHATAHEVLGCSAGEVRVQLGGPNGTVVTLVAGDIVILPAGTAHKNLDHSTDYQIIGAYPPGQSPDMERGDGDDDALAAIFATVPVPDRNPVTGAAMDEWLNQ